MQNIFVTETVVQFDSNARLKARFKSKYQIVLGIKLNYILYIENTYYVQVGIYLPFRGLKSRSKMYLTWFEIHSKQIVHLALLVKAKGTRQHVLSSLGVCCVCIGEGNSRGGSLPIHIRASI